MGNEGLGASVCLLRPVTGGGAESDEFTLVGMPSTRLSRVHSSSLLPVCVRAAVELEQLVALDGRQDEEFALGANKAFAADGGNTDSFAFSSRGASIGARGR